MLPCINPFEWVVSCLEEGEKVVDIPFLNELAKVLEAHGIVLGTYGKIVEVLEYLKTNGVLELNYKEDGSLTIKKAY